MKNVLVIGYGNSLRSDDGLGLYAVRQMQTKIERPEVEFLEVAQLQPELAETISRKDFVVFIDAAMHGISGETHYELVFPAKKAPGMSHATDPETLLFAAKELYGNAPKALLATVAGECFGFGTKLSPEVEIATRGLAVRVTQLIDEFIGQAVAV
jgi:hydrogenase maturation protease